MRQNLGRTEKRWTHCPHLHRYFPKYCTQYMFLLRLLTFKSHFRHIFSFLQIFPKYWFLSTLVLQAFCTLWLGPIIVAHYRRVQFVCVLFKKHVVSTKSNQFSLFIPNMTIIFGHWDKLMKVKDNQKNQAASSHGLKGGMELLSFRNLLQRKGDAKHHRRQRLKDSIHVTSDCQTVHLTEFINKT